MPSDVLRDAAHHESADTSAGVRAHEDHVDALGLGRSDDRLARASCPDEEIDLDADVATSFDEPLSNGLSSIADLVDTEAKPTTW